MPAMPSERNAALQPVPPAEVPFSHSAEASRPSVQRSPSATPPLFGGSLVREQQVEAAPARRPGPGSAVARIRESFDESFETVPRLNLRSPEWLRQMFGRRRSSGTEADSPAARSPQGRSPGNLPIADSTSPSMFSQQPHTDRTRPSPAPNSIRSAAASKHGSGIQRVSHETYSADAASSPGPRTRIQTQYRSLRDGHNKPGSLFDPHAWQAMQGFDDESSPGAGQTVQRATWSTQ